MKKGMKETDSFDFLETVDKEFQDKRLFVPTKDNKPPTRPPVLMIGNETILKHQNITSIVAAPGTGKSSVCEAICSAAINPEADNLGFYLGSQVQRVLRIDMEQAPDDLWQSFDRMNRRAGKDGDNVLIIGMRGIYRRNERLEKIKEQCDKFRPELLLLDGAGDLVSNTNDLDQATEMRYFLRELTIEYNLSIVVTVHPNKGTDNPRGHVGSECLRESDGVFLIRKDGEIRTFTNDFEHGKNRNGGIVETSFMYDQNKRMMVGCEAPTIKRMKKSNPWILLKPEEINKLLQALFDVDDLTASDFKQRLRMRLSEFYPLAKTGGAVISDFYTWLQDKNYIEASGNRASKIVNYIPPENRISK
jgi:hypothetical protein